MWLGHRLALPMQPLQDDGDVVGHRIDNSNAATTRRW